MKKVLLKNISGDGMLPITVSGLVQASTHQSDGTVTNGKLDDELTYLYDKIITVNDIPDSDITNLFNSIF